jgi:Peptidase family M23
LSRVEQLLLGLAFIACIAFALGRLPEVMATPISAADDLHPLVYPLVGEEGPWRIVAGYNVSGHSPGSYRQFSLDFAAASGDSEGRTVVAPASGVVIRVDSGGRRWDPRTSNCISFQVDGHDTYYVEVCHVRYDRVYNVGDRVSRGDRIGVVGPKDNASQLPNVQVTLYTAESPRTAGNLSDRVAAPFAEIWGFSGCPYPDDGGGRPEYVGAADLPDQCPAAAPKPIPSATPETVRTAITQ